MSEEFGKWLKKNKHYWEYGEDAVPVRALGEWTWKESRTWQRHGERAQRDNDTHWAYACYERRTAYYEIAVSCLGRAEVERRLKNV